MKNITLPQIQSLFDAITRESGELNWEMEDVLEWIDHDQDCFKWLSKDEKEAVSKTAEQLREWEMEEKDDLNDNWHWNDVTEF